jgi:bis(5'-nucleosidyl)-tetraphosphatase
MRQEESFGVIPVCKIEGRWHVFLIQHNRGHYWGFPKGHAEEGETPLESAIRELKEETHLDLVRMVKEEPFVEMYQFTAKGEKISKKVSYFLAEVEGSVVLQPQEIQDGRWVLVEEAVHQITHAEGKTILAEVLKLL